MKQYNLKLTLPELNHINSLLASNERNGEYSGPKYQYMDRHFRLKDKIEEIFTKMSFDSCNKKKGK